MEDVELVQGEQLEVLEDEVLRHEVTSDVEVRAAPAEARSVLDVDARDLPVHSRNEGATECCWGKKLTQRLESMDHAGLFWRAQQHLFGRHRQPVALITNRESRIESDRDA